MADTFLVLALVFVGVFIILSLMMVHEVSKRGVKISFLWLRLYLIKYIHEYGKLTKQDTGRVGPLFYPCIISVNLSLVCVVAGLLLRS
jgi:hypothetical protein